LKNILLTTLGRGNLQETKYRFEKSEFETRYCCLALCKILEKQIDLIKVLLTKEAKEKHQNDFADSKAKKICTKNEGKNS
jgi:hypothetical protein